MHVFGNRPNIRGGVEDTRLEAKDTKKSEAKAALLKTDPFEAKYRNARGQGPRTQAQVFSKNRSSQKFIRVFKNFFTCSPVKNAF